MEKTKKTLSSYNMYTAAKLSLYDDKPNPKDWFMSQYYTYTEENMCKFFYYINLFKKIPTVLKYTEFQPMHKLKFKYKPNYDMMLKYYKKKVKK